MNRTRSNLSRLDETIAQSPIEIYCKVSVNKARPASCSIRTYKGLKANGPFAFSFFLRGLKSLLNVLTVRITLKLYNLQCLLFAIRTLISHYGWEQGKSVVWFSLRLVIVSAAKLLPPAISKLLQNAINWRANPNGIYYISPFLLRLSQFSFAMPVLYQFAKDRFPYYCAK